MKQLTRRFAVIAALFVVVMALGSVVSAVHESEAYVVKLNALNNSGVSGSAIINLNGDELTVSIHASGLEANSPHPQHIHGLDNDANATCPPQSADGGDGLVNIGDGLPFYGPVVLPLEPFPTAPGGTVDFQQTYTVDASTVEPLENRVIVLHGRSVDGEYVATLPVACGELVPVNNVLQFNNSNISVTANERPHVVVQFGNTTNVTLNDITIECVIDSGAATFEGNPNTHGAFSSTSGDSTSLSFSGLNRLPVGQNYNLSFRVNPVSGTSTVRCILFSEGIALSTQYIDVQVR